MASQETSTQGPGSLSGTILARLEGEASGRAFVFRSGGVDEDLPGSVLATRIRAMAAGMARLELAPGTVVPILAPSSAALWAAFVGCIRADLVPCILSAPTIKSHIPTYLRNLGALLERYGTDVVLGVQEYRERLEQGGESVPGLRLVPLAELPVEGDAGPEPVRRGADTAFLQHSSGSTGVPKGVALSHDQVLGHVRDYAAAIALDPERDRICSWLPLYHDMGLITSFLLPLVQGVGAFTMSPEEWIFDPIAILEVMAEDRSTLAWWPNFAFSLLAERAGEGSGEDQDLSHLRMLVNCSEPVLPESFERFRERLGDRGLGAGVLQSCYAMAENVFAVTQSGGAGPRVLEVAKSSLDLGEAVRTVSGPGEGHGRVMSSGGVIENVEVRIVDPERRPLEDGQVGEIAIAGASRFTEYLQLPEVTAAACEGAWYHTGDSGFLLDDELFVLGRISDLIIVRGRKYFPNFIEEVVNRLDGVKKGRVVAFGLRSEEKGTEELAVLVESPDHEDRKTAGRLKREIRRDVLQRVDCVVDHVRVLAPGSLIKTSSGKIARKDCCAWFARELGRERC